MVEKIYNFLASLRLTVVCLGLGLLLVFVGTLAQVDEGLYQAQARFFKSWLVVGLHFGPHRKIPVVLPGGYLLGMTLLANLLAAHFKRFHFSARKTGIVLTHFGIILLLLGQLLTDMLSVESGMRLHEGDTRNYSQDFRANELVIMDTTDKDFEDVVAIPEQMVAAGGTIRHDKLPFAVQVKEFWPNSNLATTNQAGFLPVKATQGIGPGLFVQPMKVTATMDDRNMPSAVVELASPKGSLGSWLVSPLSGARQEFHHEGRTYEIAMRFTRYYKPYAISLIEFRHDKYKGTEIPMNFSSRIRVQHIKTGEDREVLIKMNQPLRYAGETYYQAGFDEREPDVTILQVVRNPGWLTPYFACILVATGLIVQFLIHLVGFATKRRAA